MSKTLTHALFVTMLAALLSACGGGESDEEEHQQRPGVDCAARPELCR